MAQQPKKELVGEISYYISTPGSPNRFKVTIPDIPFEIFWRAYTIRQMVSAQDLVKLFWLSRVAYGSLEEVKKQIPDLDVDQSFRQFWNEFPTMLPQPPEGVVIETQVDHVLALTYTWLRERYISHKEAAQFASSVLGREIKPDTWRKRVDRWAEAHNLPKVELKRTKP